MEVPNEGDLANVSVIEPRKAVEEGIRLGADGVGGQGGDILGVGGYHRFYNPFSTLLCALKRKAVWVGCCSGSRAQSDSHDVADLEDPTDLFKIIG
ncbi:hypothetical protein B296_00007064 [Ensete ventricosum]|uniref:Uncharacterized protein n=1 Tax=Ensete ventricosum TaxID=4639 RepID=A0A427A585_ENSVE|nr:hypothetical protein B296_00007064 [Ensete ventricosum]